MAKVDTLFPVHYGKCSPGRKGDLEIIFRLTPSPGIAVTPTPRPTDGVDVYFGMPGEISEHEGFLRAKMDLEERRMRQINEVMIVGHPRITHNIELLKYKEIPQ